MPDRSTLSGQKSPRRPADPALATWDTAYVAPTERFSYFREGICQAVCAFSPENHDNQDIEARVERFQLTQGVVGRIHTTPLRVYRGQADISRIPGEYLSLGLQLGGGLEGWLGGRPYSQRTGEIRFISANENMDCNIDEDAVFSTVVLSFPQAILESDVEIDGSLPLTPASVESLRPCFLLINERLRHASQEQMTHLFDATLSLDGWDHRRQEFSRRSLRPGDLSAQRPPPNDPALYQSEDR